MFRSMTRWNAQGDLAGDWINVKSENATIGMYSAALHGYWRDPGSFAVGAFANWQGTSFDGEMSDLYAVMAGPEAQVYFDKVTSVRSGLFGATALDRHRAKSTTHGASAASRAIMCSRTCGCQRKLPISRSILIPAANSVAFAAQGDYRFDNSPVSVFGRYQFEHFYLSDTSSHLTATSFRLGYVCVWQRHFVG